MTVANYNRHIPKHGQTLRLIVIYLMLIEDSSA